MREIEIMDSFYREFGQKHPEFSDLEFVLSPSKVTYLRQMALANHQTLALCNAGRNDYDFIHICNNDFRYLLRNNSISVKEFFNFIHKDDLTHFMNAWQLAFRLIENITTQDLLNFALVFECRILNFRKEYCRIIFKYMIVTEDDGLKRAQPLLFLKAVDCGESNKPSNGIYFINMIAQTMVYSSKGYTISAREIEIIKLGQQGLTSKEIADKLGIKIPTVNNHKANILNKLSVSSNSHAAMYLHFMGMM